MMKHSYELYISPKTKVFNFFRKFFIFSGIDKLLADLTRRAKSGTLPAKLVPPNYLYPPDTLRRCSIGGIHFLVDISETNGHSSYFSLDEEGQELMFSNIKEGMTVIDIGANIGALTLKFAKKVGLPGKVFSFEPSPVNYKRAAKNISLNDFTNITLINQGLGNEKSTALLYNVNPNNRGMLRILQDGGQFDRFETEEVEIDTLDASMERFSIPRPEFIKIDVEGFEYKVLKGARNTLNRCKPVLFIELDDNNLQEQKSTAKEVVRFLKQMGYQIVNTETKEEIDENSHVANCHFDILCTAK